jgi:hypothetical protein
MQNMKKEHRRKLQTKTKLKKARGRTKNLERSP